MDCIMMIIGLEEMIRKSTMINNNSSNLDRNGREMKK